MDLGSVLILAMEDSVFDVAGACLEEFGASEYFGTLASGLRGVSLEGTLKRHNSLSFSGRERSDILLLLKGGQGDDVMSGEEVATCNGRSVVLE